MTSKPVRTDDGSFTLRHPEVGETYHSLDGAETETRVKFIEPSRLKERCRNAPVRLLDVGFGLGLNCRAALACAKDGSLQIDTLEHETQSLEQGLILFPDDPLLIGLKAKGVYQNVTLHLGDLRKTLPALTQPYDLIFHDPFSPVRNSECWTVEVFQQLFRLLKSDGALLTYSQSNMVRAAMSEAGFVIQNTTVPEGQRGGTIAFTSGTGIALPSSIPYRDPDLNASGHDIRSRREATLRASVSCDNVRLGVKQGRPASAFD